MRARLITVLVFGFVGAAVLVSLGAWQLQRLAWKEGILADIETRIAADPVALPDAPDPVHDRYLPVAVDGTFLGEPLRVLVSLRGAGAGYRLIQAFETAERRILIDRGFVPEAAEPGVSVPDGPVQVTGNLHWPDEVDGFTPAPDIPRNQWFARDVAAMATYLETEPTLIILRAMSEPDPSVTPLPVTSEGIPNNHFGYAVQWFGLAIVWLGMTAFLGWRITRRTG